MLKLPLSELKFTEYIYPVTCFAFYNPTFSKKRGGLFEICPKNLNIFCGRENSQRTFCNNPRLAYCFGIKVNASYCKEAITTHPDYLAMTAVTDFLEAGGMGSM
jgi:hypothetical protein